jgi:uncharacterized membrane protein YphA (DoxX/SURF4 family)
MEPDASAGGWRPLAAFLARLIFAGVFGLGLWFKLAGMAETAGYIAAAGFPAPTLLAWLATIFEALLVLAFLTGAWFTEACLLAAIYVVFLGFSFHGPARWEGNQMEFGFFVDHFTFLAGLLFAACYGPGAFAFRRGRL